MTLLHTIWHVDDAQMGWFLRTCCIPCINTFFVSSIISMYILMSSSFALSVLCSATFSASFSSRWMSSLHTNNHNWMSSLRIDTSPLNVQSTHRYIANVCPVYAWIHRKWMSSLHKHIATELYVSIIHHTCMSSLHKHIATKCPL